MANELQTTTPLNCYAVLRNSALARWLTAGTSFETHVDGNWASYVKRLTRVGTSQTLAANLPAAASVAPGLYSAEIYAGESGSELISDPLLDRSNHWNTGAAWVSEQQLVSALFTTAMTEAYAADGAAPTPAQALFLIMQAIMEMSISGTTVTIKRLNKIDPAATCTLNNATNPTSRTRAT